MGKQKKVNWNFARNMDVDAWRARQVHKRMAEHLKQREESFVTEHGGDSNAELMAYIQSKAKVLGRMPHPLELDGGKYLQQRLGDWQLLARRLGYIPVSKARGEVTRQRLKEQIAEQFAQERRALKTKKRMESAIRKARADHSQEIVRKEKDW